MANFTKNRYDLAMGVAHDQLKGAIHALASLAHQNPYTFCEFVLKDERSGKRIVNGEMHEVWHKFITDNDRVVIWASVESGKTQQVTIGRTLWELGHDPSKRCLVVSKSKNQAEKFIRPMRHYIENSQELRLVFPEMRPGKRWTDGAFDVAAKGGAAKDFSVECSGLDGNILGARYDFVVIDDLLDWETTRTRYQREKVLSWLRTTVFGRLTAEAKVIFLANAWEKDDAAHVFAKEGWGSMRSPLINWDTGELAWSKQWSRERIEKYKKSNPAEFDRQIMCMPRKPGEQRFREEWLSNCLERGRGRTLVYELEEMPKGYRTVTGVDLGIGVKDHHDETAICTLLISPYREREILWIEAGRWSAPEIVKRVLEQHRRYGSVIFVENNAAQDFLVQFARLEGDNVPIRRFTTGRNKWHPSYGVEGIAAEMSAGKWIIPSGKGDWLEDDVQKWVDEMRYFDPGSHTGDRLMASWIAREGARRDEGVHRVDFIPREREQPLLDTDASDPVGKQLWDDLRHYMDLDDDEDSW